MMILLDKIVPYLLVRYNFLEETYFNVVECNIFGHIVDKKYSVCTAVVGGCDCAESLSTSCIPDLEFDGPFIEFDGADFKVYSDARDVQFGVGAVYESQKESRFLSSNSNIL